MLVKIFDNKFIPGIGRGPFEEVSITEQQFGILKRLGINMIKLNKTTSIEKIVRETKPFYENKKNIAKPEIKKEEPIVEDIEEEEIENIDSEIDNIDVSSFESEFSKVKETEIEETVEEESLDIDESLDTEDVEEETEIEETVEEESLDIDESLDTEDVEEETEIEETVEEEIDLEAMTKKQIQDLLTENNIEFDNKLNKTKLIELAETLFD